MMPFTAEQFFDVFARYNEHVWPMQVALYAAALAAIALLRVGGASGGRAIAAILALLWAWMAIAYHFAFFAPINRAAWGFGAMFLAAALAFAWTGVVQGRLQFRLDEGWRGLLGAALLAYALFGYPLVGYAVGHRYPAVPTFGLPCPTTIFTLGMLMFAAPPLPRAIVIVPLIWSAIGSAAAFELNVVQDFGLLAAGLVGLAATLSARTRARSY